MSWPGPNPGGSARLPCLPPMALAQPPPPTAVVTHGIHALAETIAAKSATSQPGCSRRIMVATLAEFDVGLSDARRCLRFGPGRAPDREWRTP